jgi:hypothetical protein
MRRTIAAALVAAATALAVLPGPIAVATDDVSTGPTGAAPQIATDEQAEQAEQALATVTRLLTGKGATLRADAGASTPDLTLAMRDLYVALPRLDAGDRERALALLARPTEGGGDRSGDGYSVPSEKKCGGNFCIHYVTSTTDAPPSTSWVNYTLKQMNKVWKHEVKRMGFRKPLPDTALGKADNGGNSKYDVYLKDLGSRGLYGYCAPEAELRGKKYRWQAISYCVLDNDFSPDQYGGTAPKPTLQVTAAHEFFHAVQFSYDYGDDRWLLESTATWMEERYADKVDDNRQYLPASQVAAPYLPLDMSGGSISNQYGNWVFWEYLGKRFGQDIVRDVWSGTAPKGKRNSYAIATLKKVLKRHGGFDKVYREFASANVFPAKAYQEGKFWPTPQLTDDLVLSSTNRTVAGGLQIAHLAAQHVRVRPDATLGSKKWKLKIKVDGPSRASAPGAVVTVQLKSGKLVRQNIKLNRKGKGSTKVKFSRKKVRSVTVTAVNGSTRFACYTADPSADPRFSCQGVARDDASVFALKFTVKK